MKTEKSPKKTKGKESKIGEKILLICNFGGQIVQNKNDGNTLYEGGDARATMVARDTSFTELQSKLAEISKLRAASFSIKYQAIDSHALISVYDDNDVETMLYQFGDSRSIPMYISRTQATEDTVNTNRVEERLVDEDGGGGTGDIENPQRSAQGMPCTGDIENPESSTPRVSCFGDIENRQTLAPGVSCIREIENEGVSCSGELETPGLVLREAMPKMAIGKEFEDVRSFRRALISFAIAENFVIKYATNDLNRVTAKCQAEGCTWRIHASRISGFKKFRVKTMNPTHTCRGWLNGAHPQAGSKWIADRIKQRLKDNPKYKPREIIDDIRRHYGVQVTYLQAWQGKELAMADIRGSSEEAYRMLPSYCQKLIDTNPGTVANIKVDEGDNSFKRLFVAFHATISGFLRGCRPLITLDESLLKTKYRGHLLAAVAMDADGGMFPMAFSVSVSDDIESWVWFLTLLREVLVRPETPKLMFISEKQKGLQTALETVFPDAFHAFSMGSLAENFNDDLRNCELTRYFWLVARAKTLSEFEARMVELGAVSEAATAWIEGIPAKFWAAAYCEGMRYNHLTSKLLESFNKWLDDSRDLPIIKFVESLRMKLMEHLHEQRELSMQWTSKLVPSADEKIKRRTVKAHPFRIFRSNGTQFEILSDKVDEVNLERQECTCRRWQLSGLPCAHAIAAINAKGDPISDYCSPHLYVETYRNTFMETIHPVPDRTPMPEVRDFLVNPPRIRRPSGRPKKKRVKTGNNEVRPIHCRKCGGLGHNRQRCKQPE
ncbi:uncharacterized protein LOC18439213 [Amborella trichopoda]|uniref:SWIM-type domain-containing protein n=1 Tax=Amborella trichopoda TaxID=13333 RepID=W1PT45_AMBTC|nr:uncharacterized protein LOC18439213 [Amborella trichopoda]ERN11029.1 hypothetical protein AMTR_s00024p00070170 [Amborella trichopoda]|eukprot:XP_011625246.2 uncharacterized protein LOC18439213 [Amborella trichopoda]